MKLNPTLTKKQREDLLESTTCIAKLLRQLAATQKKRANLEGFKTKALAKLAEAQTASETGDEDASLKVLARNHQLGQLRLSIARAEQEFSDLLTEGAKMATIVRNEIRTVHAPLLKPFIEALADLMAPFTYARQQAVDSVAQLYAPGQLQMWARALPSYRHFESPEELIAALQSLGETLAAMLDGKAVIALRTDGEEGGFAFPAHV